MPQLAQRFASICRSLARHATTGNFFQRVFVAVVKTKTHLITFSSRGRQRLSTEEVFPLG